MSLANTPSAASPSALGREKAACRRSPWIAALRDLVGRIEVGQCTVVLPDGTAFQAAGSHDLQRRGAVYLHRTRAARRLFLGGDLGFAEAYLDGDWDSPDLPAFLELALLNEHAVSFNTMGQRWLKRWHRLRHRLRANTRRGSRRNIASHYDLSNDFYAAWLDPGMTYSSALYSAPGQTLSEAQAAKYRSLAAMLGLAPGQRLLEIGCGWGAFALMAAQEYGCHVTAVTLSQAQANHARARVAAEGLQDRIEVRLQDYRDIDGTYDRIASIEMFEAVGEAYWPQYFRVLQQRLAEGGCAALQVITIDDARFESYRRRADFIQAYIFPGGMLPSPSALQAHSAAAGLHITGSLAFGASYARTVAEWRAGFRRAAHDIAQMGFDERFRRMWDYYLAYCQAGFAAGSIDVTQLRLARP
jgi:cyclopropane-fatty-acyl-phospholipid synthase